MRIILMPDGVVFVGLSEEQEIRVVKLSDKCRLKDTPKGLKAHGKAENIYRLLYDLSFLYDIEIV